MQSHPVSQIGSGPPSPDISPFLSQAKDWNEWFVLAIVSFIYAHGSVFESPFNLLNLTFWVNYKLQNTQEKNEFIF